MSQFLIIYLQLKNGLSISLHQYQVFVKEPYTEITSVYLHVHLLVHPPKVLFYRHFYT
jgi:hypothetical protein